MALHMPTFLPRPSLPAFHTLPGISHVQAVSQKLVANPLMTDSAARSVAYAGHEPKTGR